MVVLPLLDSLDQGGSIILLISELTSVEAGELSRLPAEAPPGSDSLRRQILAGSSIARIANPVILVTPLPNRRASVVVKDKHAR